jgi:hypothetical protein
MSNTSAEQIISVFGTANGSSITSLGFKTSTGGTYAPWGPGQGDPFAVDGLILGFFGALEDGAISGLGVWYTPTTTFKPGQLPLRMNYLEMSAAFGDMSSVATWDDSTPDMGGAPMCSRLHMHMWLAQRHLWWLD